MNWKPTPRRAAWVLILVNLALWLIPSDVARQIARDRQTILGFYSLEKFTAQLGLLLLSLPALCILLARPDRRRQRVFRVVAVLLVLLPGLLAVDLILRARRTGQYVQESSSYHRPPNYSSRVTFVDEPLAKRTYPDAPPGYPPIDCRFTCDSRGFRNAGQSDACDLVAVGDSFVEGPEVSDEHPWPVLLARRTGLKVYNAGMAGGNTHDYLLNLENIALKLRPRLAMVMIFEGNDFRGTGISIDRDEREDDVAHSRFELFFKVSPLVLAGRRLIENHLAPINSRGWVPNAQALALMPIRLGPAGARKPYTFDPKALLAFDKPTQEFAAGRGFLDSRRAILEMASDCKKQGAQLVIVYAPHKTHILLPLITDQADKLRDFLSLVKRGLPPAGQLVPRLIERVEVPEQATADLCRSEGIHFVSLTAALREGLLRGRQVYFTYDQHWTPEGHQVVAAELDKYLRNQGLLAAPSSQPSTAPSTAPASRATTVGRRDAETQR